MKTKFVEAKDVTVQLQSRMTIQPDANKVWWVIHRCGCWEVNLAQGKAFLTCKDHEPKVRELLES